MTTYSESIGINLADWVGSTMSSHQNAIRMKQQKIAYGIYQWNALDDPLPLLRELFYLECAVMIIVAGAFQSNLLTKKMHDSFKNACIDEAKKACLYKSGDEDLIRRHLKNRLERYDAVQKEGPLAEAHERIANQFFEFLNISHPVLPSYIGLSHYVGSILISSKKSLDSLKAEVLEMCRKFSIADMDTFELPINPIKKFLTAIYRAIFKG